MGLLMVRSSRHNHYRMAGNFGGKIVWRIAEMSFGGIYLAAEPA